MKLNKLVLVALTIALTFTSCSNDDNTVVVVPLGDYENGILISNEGNFFQGNASVSYVSLDLETVENNVFSTVNSSLLGDTAQSITFAGEKAYIIVNVSQKIEVVNRFTFESITTIDSGFTNPRYMVVANGKGYVTDWGEGSSATDDFVAVINLQTNTIESTISVGEGPEQIVANNNTLYITHKGGWNINNVVSRINIATSEVTEITVNDKPDEMAFDAQGNLMVLCEGNTIYNDDFSEIIGHTLGSLTKIDTNTNTVLSNLNFNIGDHPTLFAIDAGDNSSTNSNAMYYYSSGNVYKVTAGTAGLPLNPIISETLYGSLVLNYGKLYATKTDFTAGTGQLLIFDLVSYNLLATKELKVGASKVYVNN